MKWDAAKELLDRTTLTIGQVAERLGVSHGKIARMCKENNYSVAERNQANAIARFESNWRQIKTDLDLCLEPAVELATRYGMSYRTFRRACEGKGYDMNYRGRVTMSLAAKRRSLDAEKIARGKWV